jgi:Ser/Thr protein kinase RdoA (MazF antagonist)
MTMRMSVTDWHDSVSRDTPGLIDALAPLYNIHSLEKVETKSWNAIFRGGACGTTLCVKVINEKSSGYPRMEEDFTRAIQMATTLHSTGFTPAIPPVRGRDGRYVRRAAGYWTMVYPWIDVVAQGLHREDSFQKREVAERGAALLARLHFATISSLSKDSEVRCAIPYAYGPHSWLLATDDLWGRVELALRDRGATSAHRALVAEARECGVRITQQFPFFFQSTAHHIWTHGDYRPENVFVGLEPYPADYVFDFDMAHESAREAEVAYAALSFGGPRWFCGARDWRVVRTFIGAYRAESAGWGLSTEQFQAAMLWTVVKAMSLSFKVEQLERRLLLYLDLSRELPMLLQESCE